MQVTLKADPNSDFSPNEHAGCVRRAEKFVDVNSLTEARRVCLAFIEENDLGGGNWTGGQVWSNGAPIAHVSYNGRVWKGVIGKWPTDEIIF